jgi:hypothetical protein
MRSSIATVAILSLLFAGSYFYYVAHAMCPAPLSYSLGELDTRFNLSSEEAQLAIAHAESIWEDATGRNLFTSTQDGELTVNFIFDDRQKGAQQEAILKETLDATQTVNDAMRETYETLVARYNERLLVYNDAAASYDARLDVYNEKVEQYNIRGGAPASVYESLEKERRALETTESQLKKQSAELSSLVHEINAVGEKANKMVNTYNQSVDVYNSTYAQEREFIQGDYSDGVIHIYTFDSYAELVLVLVHELGHALSLEHVDDPLSAMHAILKDGQGETLTIKDVALSQDDLAEFERVCGGTALDRMVPLMKTTVAQLMAR